MSEIQLSNPSNFNPKNIIFQNPVAGNVKDTTIKFRRIPIQIKYPNGNIGDLILPTQRSFSFGVCENISPETKKSNGFVFPIVLASKDGQTQGETDFIEAFNSVIDECKNYLLSNKKELKLHDLEPALLKKLNPIWIKMDKDSGGRAEGALPTLYVKLIVSKKDGNEKIISNFYDKNTEKQLNPLDLLKQYCYTNAAIKIESIFVGKNISVQVKLYEADIELLNSGNKKRLLPRVQPDSNVTIASSNPLLTEEVDFDEESSITSDVEDEDVPEPEPALPVKKPVVKKVVAKKVTK